MYKPRKSSYITVCGSGSYLHYELDRALIDLLKKMPNENISSHITTDIYIDELPFSKSSKSQLWPILGKIAGIIFLQVFVIGAYHRSSMPDSIDESLDPFITKYENLKENGFFYNGKTYTVEINIVICGSPARSMVTYTKSHNGYFDCPRCIDKRNYLEHRMCFLSTSSKLRTDESFLLKKNTEHHTGDSPFEKILNMVTQFPLDPMHLRGLGIGKQIFKLLLNGEKRQEN